MVTQELARWQASSPAASPRSIVIKPNWVLHETDAAFPIRALVTSSALIEAVVTACLAQFPAAQIVVGDVPLQYADFALLRLQSGLDAVIARFADEPRVRFLDLRRDVMERDATSFMRPIAGSHGDPRGYRLVQLGTLSHLEPISDQAQRFAVNDYRGEVTSSNHRRGHHNYFISQTILDCDLFINLPKWKAHQKSAITGALKNVVGISCDKAYLPHFRRGAPAWGGDEYRDDHRWMYLIQTRVREALQKRSAIAFKLLKPGWELFKKLRGIETRMATAGVASDRFYIAGGSWFGNDTIWRMIYDLNSIIELVDREGVRREHRQRGYLCIVDGVISGEGNGPLQPLPRDTDWLVCGDDPFAVDTTLAWFMGFAPEKIPILARRDRYLGAWGEFEVATLPIELDGSATQLPDSAVNFGFTPPPGWKGHVERPPGTVT